MVQENTYNETEIRRFLLGEMSADARIAFEINFTSDENLFDKISVAEDELIESYLREMLSPAEKTNFEREFMSTETLRQRVAFTRTMLDKINKNEYRTTAKKIETAAGRSSVWETLISLVKFPKLAFGAAFALLVLIFGGWFLIRNEHQTEIVKQISPTSTVGVIEPNQNQNAAINETDSVNANTNAAANTPGNKNDLPSENRATTNTSQNTNKPKKAAVGGSPILALFVDGVRSEGKMPELNLPRTALGANLQLNLESVDYKLYSVEIINPNGNPIFTIGKLTTRNSKINFFIPEQKLPIGEYIVKLSALNPKGENESVADYPFRINRK